MRRVTTGTAFGLYRHVFIDERPGDVCMARDTHVFAGTLSRGLLVYDRQSGRWHAFDDGLPSRNVTALAFDGDTLYVGTDNGVVRISANRFGS